MEWRGREWSGVEGRGGQGRAWNGQPHSTVYAENASYTYLLGLRFTGLDNLRHTYFSIAGSMTLAEW